MAHVSEFEQIIKQGVADCGYDFIGIDPMVQGERTILRVYVDVVGGIKLDQVAELAKYLDGMLNVSFPDAQHYLLEVSSPGLDRRLFDLQQYQQFIGQNIKITLKNKIDNMKKLQGRLKKVEGNLIILENNEFDQDMQISYVDIDKGRLIPKVEL